MQRSINHVTLVGKVGADPKITTVNRQKVASFPLCTAKSYKDKDGVWQSKETWHNIAAWREIADLVENTVTKGCEVHVEGEITMKTLDGEGGKKTRYYEITAYFIGSYGRVSAMQKQGNLEPRQKPEEQDDDLPY